MIWWIREFFGWLLVLLGLYVFYIAMQLLLREGPRILEAPAFIAIGFFIFRGGLQVLKVSVAARLCLAAQAASRREQELGSSAKRGAPALSPSAVRGG